MVKMDQNEGGMKVEIPGETENMTCSPRGSSHGLTTQTSNASARSSGTCLCSPTTHAGSFRCRLHRAPSLHRTKSMDPPSSKPDATHSNANSASNSAIQAQ